MQIEMVAQREEAKAQPFRTHKATKARRQTDRSFIKQDGRKGRGTVGNPEATITRMLGLTPYGSLFAGRIRKKIQDAP